MGSSAAIAHHDAQIYIHGGYRNAKIQGKLLVRKTYNSTSVAKYLFAEYK